MNTKDIKHLANLSRLHLTDEEVDAYTKQFDEIVAYVDKIKEFYSNNEILDQVGDDVSINSNDEIPGQARDDMVVVGDDMAVIGDDMVVVGDDVPVNVMREDKVNSYPQPETIVNEAPDHQDNFVKVKKILNQ